MEPTKKYRCDCNLKYVTVAFRFSHNSTFITILNITKYTVNRMSLDKQTYEFNFPPVSCFSCMRCLLLQTSTKNYFKNTQQIVVPCLSTKKGIDRILQRRGFKLGLKNNGSLMMMAKIKTYAHCFTEQVSVVVAF